MKEIERRFLLNGLPEDLWQRAYKVISIKHAYLPGNIVVERFSQSKYLKDTYHRTDAKVYSRTVKIGHGVERLEYKDSCSKDLFKSMWGSPHTALIKKVSHHVIEPLPPRWPSHPPVANLIWEVDCFLNRDLYLAEVEIPFKEYPVRIPQWLQPFLVTEVTYNREFEGAKLAMSK